MGFLKGVKSLLKRTEQPEKAVTAYSVKPILNPLQNQQIGSNFIEHRAFDRYFVKEPTLAYLTYENQAFRISSLSYGGMGIIASKNSAPKTVNGGLLHVLDEHCEVDMDHKHSQDNFAGYQFRHQRPASLLFLREHLEGLRISQSMGELDPQIINESYKNENVLVLRGEGPTDFILTLDAQGSRIVQFLCTFLKEGTYYQFEFKNGKIFTGQAMPGLNLSPRMEMHSEPKAYILRHAICLALGLKNEGICNILAPVVTIAISHLGIATPSFHEP